MQGFRDQIPEWAHQLGGQEHGPVWQQLLEQFAEQYPAGDWEEACLPMVEALVRSLGEGRVLQGVETVGSHLGSEAEAALLRVLVRAGERVRAQLDQEVAHLRQTLRELATPVIRIWTDVLLVPLVGGLDYGRAEILAETVLEAASAERTRVVLVDVTGVAGMDTAVGSFLLEMFAALRLLGTKVVLTGIRPHVAHTLVKLGIDFGTVDIARDLEDALRKAIAFLQRPDQGTRDGRPGRLRGLLPAPEEMGREDTGR